MADDLREAIALLRRKRSAALAVVEKYDKALAALLALDEGSQDDEVPAPAPPARAEPPAPRPSVLTMARTLLDEGDRLWTAAAIIDEYEKRGTPIQAADPANALRTALSTLVKRGEAYRESPGYFRSAVFHKEPESDHFSETPVGELHLTGS